MITYFMFVRKPIGASTDYRRAEYEHNLAFFDDNSGRMQSWTELDFHPSLQEIVDCRQRPVDEVVRRRSTFQDSANFFARKRQQQEAPIRPTQATHSSSAPPVALSHDHQYLNAAGSPTSAFQEENSDSASAGHDLHV